MKIVIQRVGEEACGKIENKIRIKSHLAYYFVAVEDADTDFDLGLCCTQNQ